MHRKGKSKNIKSLFRDWVHISVCHLTSCAKKMCKGYQNYILNSSLPQGCCFSSSKPQMEEVGYISGYFYPCGTWQLPLIARGAMYANSNSVAEYGII